MSWEEKRLGDVLTLKRGYDLTEAQRQDGDIPVVSSSGITGSHNVAMVKAPGVVTGRYGTMGEVFYVERDFWPHNTALYVRDFKGNNPRFIAYFLKNVLRGTNSNKAAVPGVNRNDLHERRVLAPDISTQGRIVEHLESLDDLIENNRRRIKLLEDAARLLYREWFVHLRFPGHEHVKMVDGVPEGWARKVVPDLIAINPTERIERGREAWYVPMAALSETGMIVDRGDFERRTVHTAVKFRTNDVLLARITPCLENGKTGFVYFLDEGDVACGSTEFIILRGISVSPYFVYCLARTYDFREHAIKSMIGSSGRQRVQAGCFDEYGVFLPPSSLLSEFDDSVAPMFKQIAVLDQQTEKLRQARDLLLPRLMSGELSV
ncbi:MAG: restriction endonuclease subunit S [Thermomonas sp.]|uniref:restriction endonuclease subunit S n=1 Tax=Thermomonas sp. TaxID=1971895 RepID=UPI001E09D242|nr:restriction endonuclease subunit S [Thermomonas sp.]MBZ0086615.1 restriction endonuclease subunit S [Thermomonas sp.]